MKHLLDNYATYICDVLGISVRLEPWHGIHRIPFYLSDAYQFSQCVLLDTPCLLMQDRSGRDVNPLAIAKHMAQMRQQWDGVVIYLCEAVSPYMRRRLIEQQIPFVVPGSQLYLPSLGVDLREYYRKRRPTVQVFSPSTQVVVLYALHHRDAQPYTPSALAKHLGYTRMTMARAFDELEAAEIGEIEQCGRERLLYFSQGMQALWELTRTRLRTPVKKRLWTHRPLTEWAGVPAGLTALASYSMLVAPDRPVYALSLLEWQTMDQQWYATEYAIPAQDDGYCELELWSYSPRLIADSDRVDPFSLYLSLEHEADERIHTALVHMVEQVAW